MNNVFKWIAVTWALATSAGLAVACGSDDESSGDATCSASEAAAVPTTLFPQSCGTGLCHDLNADDGLDSESLLDLIEPNVATTVKDRPSDDCPGKLIVDSANPSQSYLIEKVTSDNPTCGDPMPSGGRPALSAKQQACVRAWVEQVAGQ
jgi:hypothetical protein